MPARSVSRLCAAPALFQAAAARCETALAITIRTANTTKRALPLRPTLLQPFVHRSSQTQQTRPSSSSTRWKSRQSTDPYTKSSKLSVLKSRAAYKLLEINDKHKLFRPGQSVVDLGYAPGSWSQVAKNRVGDTGRVVGIDVIPAQPPRGVSALQGDFLSESVQGLVRDFVREWKGREHGGVGEDGEEGDGEVRSVLERAREHEHEQEHGVEVVEAATEEEKDKHKKKDKKLSAKAQDLQQGRVVDVVLSDMCAPFPGLEIASWINSVNRPYRRMMNTSGNPFRDHAGSIVRCILPVCLKSARKLTSLSSHTQQDLCMAALTFSHDCLVTGGHFLCKFYQGPEDKDLENRMKRMFEKVHRIKPDSSRKESRESYFVGLRRKADVSKEEALR